MKRKYVKIQNHHIIPKSRKGVITKPVPADYHKAYHKLFENLTPQEILEYLKQVWFVSGEFIRPLDWMNNK